VIQRETTIEELLTMGRTAHNAIRRAEEKKQQQEEQDRARRMESVREFLADYMGQELAAKAVIKRNEDGTTFSVEVIPFSHVIIRLTAWSNGVEAGMRTGPYPGTVEKFRLDAETCTVIGDGYKSYATIADAVYGASVLEAEYLLCLDELAEKNRAESEHILGAAASPEQLPDAETQDSESEPPEPRQDGGHVPYDRSEIPF
jgi:hypothetical protein